MRLSLILGAFMPLASVSAQMPDMAAKLQPACERAAIVPGFEDFDKPRAGEPAIGKATAVTLERLNVPPAVTGGRPPKLGTYQGHYRLTVAKAGNYRVALSQGAWISLGQAAGEVESTKHGHGPTCSGIAKIVTFPLKPGTYHLDLSEAKAAAITVAVAAD
jgi:hypothetical protein